MKPTQEMITIVGDGITVTARKYVDGELTCSARCVKMSDAAYNFDKQAVDAMYALMTKQNDSAVEYCKADADVTKQYYEYRKAHPELFPEEQEDGGPECDEPDCDVQEETTKYPKIYQSVADCVEEAEIIYYEGRPEVFWKDFKGGSFIIKVSRDEWSELVASAESYGVTWATGEELGRLFPFKRTKDVVYVGKGIHRMYSPGILYCYDIAHISDFEKRNCIAWSDIKEALMTTDTSTNDAKDTSVPWGDIMDRKCIIRVRKQDWKKFAEQAAANDILWVTGETFSVEDVYPGDHLDLDAVYIGCTVVDHGLVWSSFPESFQPELTIIYFSRWCNND